VHELLYPLAGHAKYGDEAKLLAGGHSLLPMMKVRPAPPGLLVNVGHLDELRYLRREGVAVGALTRHSHLVTPTWCGNPPPLLGLVASHVGDPQAGTAAPSAVPWRTRTRLRT
jgi:carbon-monoxide dehydrogenase medium subunit